MSWQLFCGFHIPTSDPACRFLWGLQLSPHRLKLPPVWWTPYQCRLYEFLFVQLHSLAYINQFLCTWIFLGDENPSNESRNVTSNSSLDERMQFHLSGSFLGRHRRCSFSASPSPCVEDAIQQRHGCHAENNVSRWAAPIGDNRVFQLQAKCLCS